MAPLAARLAAFAAVLLVAGCGGGKSDGDSNVHAGVKAFPDALEIARAELGEEAALLEVEVTRNTVSFTRIQFGRAVKLTYDSHVVFTGAAKAKPPKSRAQIFSIEIVRADAPARLVEAIEKREGGDVERFTARLRQKTAGKLAWEVAATVGGSEHMYTASPDGTLR